jgi:hypothetical protein
MLWAGAENVTTNEHCRVLAIGNPDDNSSKFAKVCQHSPLWRSHPGVGVSTPRT